MTALVNIICAHFGYIMNSEKNIAELKGMCIIKGFDIYFQISLQNNLPMSTPTGNRAARGKHGYGVMG